MNTITLEESLKFGPVGDPSRFTGAAGARLLSANDGAESTRVLMVGFEPGVRNHWHAHSGGQLLHVLEGECWVQSRGEDARKVRTGGSAVFDKDEVHWHGASAAGPMRHLAVTMGETTWFEESPAPE